MKTLVIILSETRAHKLTFDNFEKNVLNVLNADLCVCIGLNPDYDYTNPFYTRSKYKFLYNEPEDFGQAFDEAYQELIPLNTETDPLHWRKFLEIKDQFLGGVKGDNQHPGSAGILIFFRWYLLKQLTEHHLIQQYDRFVITRSDYIYQLPHPRLELLEEKYIWIPNGEHYGGYTDRHVILNKDSIVPYLNIFNQFVLKSNEYYTKLKSHDQWNLEKIIKFNLDEQNQIVKEYPYVMYAVRSSDTGTRWAQGTYSEELGYYIKYMTEYEASSQYKKEFIESGLSIDEFYKKHITPEGFANQNRIGNHKNIIYSLILILLLGILWVQPINIEIRYCIVLFMIATLALLKY